MHQAVLVHADVDEGAEVGDVGDDALELHARLQIGQGLDAVAEAGGPELGAGIAAGLFQLAQDVPHRGLAEGLVGEVVGGQAAQQLRVADEFAHVASGMGEDALDHRIGFGVHRRGVEGIVALHDAQEAGGLFEGLWTEAGHLEQGLAVREGAVFLPVAHDVVGQGFAQAGHPGQQGRRGGVHFHAHGIHAVFHHRIELAGELVLVDVVLVLADADGLGIDLHQLGQGILQAAGDGHGAAEGNVEIRKFLRRPFRSRIDRSARLADHERGQAQPGVLADQFLHQPIGFPRGGAVADAHQLHAMTLRQFRQDGDGLVPAVLRCVGMDDGRLQQLAGGVAHHHLHAGAQARVQPHDGARPGRRGEQQIPQVFAEHANGLFLGPLAQAQVEIGLELHGHLDPPGPAHGPGQPVVGGPAPLRDPEVGGDGPVAHAHRLGGFGIVLSRQVQAQSQHAFAAAAEQRQGAMGGNGPDGLPVVEIVGELGAGLFLAVDHLRRHEGVRPQAFAQGADQIRLLGHPLHEDLPGAFEDGTGVGKAGLGIDEGLGGGLRHLPGIVQQPVEQRLDARLAGDLRLCSPLGLVGGVEILETGLGLGRLDGLAQGIVQLALLCDAAQHRLAALLQFAQIAQALFQLSQLAVVEAAGDLLAIAGDEGHGGPAVQQFDSSGDLGGPGGQFPGQGLNDVHVMCCVWTMAGKARV